MINKIIPLYLISGFLGSGKSTLLRNIIEELGNDVRIGIVQNEFSSINIDAGILAETNGNYSVLEMNNGSVFCLCLMSNFIPALSGFIDSYRPDKIFIEATGLADPLAIIQVVNSPKLIDKVKFVRAYTVVDASLFDRQINMIKAVSGQIRVADTVIINKCDKQSQSLAEEVGFKVKEINPFCNILFSQYAKLNREESDIIKHEDSTAQILTNNYNIDTYPLSSPPYIKVNTIITSKKISSENLKNLTDLIAPALRAKGFLKIQDGTVKVLQAVCDEISLKDYKLPVSRSEIVIFGEGINVSLIENLFDK
ncbi:MAG: hypothetical protein ACD_77C00253G0005 [uncultured bacterium]|nr:MAG: hypothetical protein ACD_77C00253G0005 [uncultured bacterium]HBY02175.1 hypothetical protein [Rikenellaceae bacterium]